MSAALERRAWLTTGSGQIWPNMYIVLCGPPGLGKGKVIDPVRDLLRDSETVNVGPESMTGAAMLDEFVDEAASRTFKLKGARDYMAFHSVIAVIPEFGTLVSEHELKFMSLLNVLWECQPDFQDRLRKYDGRLIIERPHMHILAGTQPKYLSTLFPETAYGMGFASRTVMIFDNRPIKYPLWDKPPDKAKLWKDLVHDLKAISKLSGEFNKTPEAAEAMNDWHMNQSDKDKPTHPKLESYCPRRILHVSKLAMAFSVSRSDSLVITLQDFQDALELLRDAESAMPLMFSSMSNNGGQRAMLDEVLEFVTEYCKTRRSVPERKVINFLTTKIPVNQVASMVDMLVKSGMVKDVTDAPIYPGKERKFRPIRGK